MTEIPREVIDAVAKLIDDNYGHLINDVEGLTIQVLEAAEKAWPHTEPQRDPASTTSVSTERAWSPVRRTPARARAERPFGFGVMKL